MSTEGLLVGLRATKAETKGLHLLRALLTKRGLSGIQLQPRFALGFSIRVCSQSCLELVVVWCLGQGLALCRPCFLHSLVYQSGYSENPRKPGQNNPNACSKGLWNLLRGSLRGLSKSSTGRFVFRPQSKTEPLTVMSAACPRWPWVAVSRLPKGTHRLGLLQALVAWKQGQ